MKKTISINDRNYIITVEETMDAHQGKVEWDNRCIIKIEIPKSEARDIEIYRLVKIPDLLVKILEDYVKSGFAKASVSN